MVTFWHPRSTPIFAPVGPRHCLKCTHVWRLPLSPLPSGEVLLQSFDDDIRRHLEKEMMADGIDIRPSTEVVGVCPSDLGLIVTPPHCAWERRGSLGQQCLSRSVGGTRRPQVERLPSGWLAATTSEGDSVSAEVVMFATGRVPNTTDLELEVSLVLPDSLAECLSCGSCCLWEETQPLYVNSHL